MVGAGEQVLRVLNRVATGLARNIASLFAHSTMILTLVEIGVTDVPVLALAFLPIVVNLIEVVHSLAL